MLIKAEKLQNLLPRALQGLKSGQVWDKMELNFKKLQLRAPTLVLTSISKPDNRILQPLLEEAHLQGNTKGSQHDPITINPIPSLNHLSSHQSIRNRL